MKVIIQIPCFNEEESLPVTLQHLPKQLTGVDTVEWLVIDDGSRDKTVEVANKMGVHHIVKHFRNLGLARAFTSGIEESLRLGADIIINTDADNQYDASCIQDLIQPILDGKAEIVIGARPIYEISYFSPIKKLLQKFGSWVVRKVSNSDIMDAPSGFRAISRSAAMKINVFSDYTYTLETIIQAGQKGISIVSVPIKTNDFLRPSRLFRSIPSYLKKSIITIIRIYMTYRPAKFFYILGMIPLCIGIIFFARFFYFYLTLEKAGHIQSLIFSALLIGAGLLLFLVGLIADLISVNRKLLEKLNWRIHHIEEILSKITERKNNE